LKNPDPPFFKDDGLRMTVDRFPSKKSFKLWALSFKPEMYVDKNDHPGCW